MITVQPVSVDYIYNNKVNKSFNMIDNYIYMYHIQKLIALPLYPESIADTMNVDYKSYSPLSRSAPIFSYANSGPRSFQVTLPLHRDMMNDVNTLSSSLSGKVDNLHHEDYTDFMINQLQAIAFPRYGDAEKMVNPPVIALRFGNDLFCKGVVSSNVTTTYEGPILRTNKYALVTISFTIQEVDPYDADTVAQVGGFRGMNTTLERNAYYVAPKFSYEAVSNNTNALTLTNNKPSSLKMAVYK